MYGPLSSRRISGIVLLGLAVCSSSLQFRLAGQKSSDATASNPTDLRYSKLHFKLESAINQSYTGDPVYVFDLHLSVNSVDASSMAQ